MPAIDVQDDDAQLAVGAETIADTTNDVQDNFEDAKAESSAVADDKDALHPSREPVLPSRVTAPMRRVGKVSIASATELGARMMRIPPRRRTPSVFGTLGREIVVYPEPRMTSVSVQSVAVGRVSHPDEEVKLAIDENAVIDVQETDCNKVKMLDDGEEANDDKSPENDAARRRIYVRFKELPRDTGAAYIHVLMGLFTENPGDDTVALVFDSEQEIIEIAAPNGVGYDEVSEVVQNIVGEDAVVEIIE